MVVFICLFVLYRPISLPLAKSHLSMSVRLSVFPSVCP